MQKTACQEWPRKWSCLSFLLVGSSRFALKGAWDWTNTCTLGPLNGEGARKGFRSQFTNESWYYCLSGCRIIRSNQQSPKPVFKMLEMLFVCYIKSINNSDTIIDSRCNIRNKMGNRKAEEEHVWISQELRVIRGTVYFTTGAHGLQSFGAYT